MNRINLFVLLIIIFENVNSFTISKDFFKVAINANVCEILFGSKYGNPAGSHLSFVETFTILYDNNYVHNIWYYYNSGNNNTLNGPNNLTNINATDVNLSNSSIVGIYIEIESNYIKCFQFNILNLTTNTSTWSPLFGKRGKRGKHSKFLQTYLYDYIPNNIQSIKTWVDVANRADNSKLYGILIKYEYDSIHGDCFPAITTTEINLPVTSTSFISTSTEIVQVPKSVPIEVYIFSITIPLIFIFLVILFCFFRSR